MSLRYNLKWILLEADALQDEHPLSQKYHEINKRKNPITGETNKWTTEEERKQGWMVGMKGQLSRHGFINAKYDTRVRTPEGYLPKWNPDEAEAAGVKIMGLRQWDGHGFEYPKLRDLKKDNFTSTLLNIMQDESWIDSFDQLKSILSLDYHLRLHPDDLKKYVETIGRKKLGGPKHQYTHNQFKEWSK